MDHLVKFEIFPDITQKFLIVGLKLSPQNGRALVVQMDCHLVNYNKIHKDETEQVFSLYLTQLINVGLTL